MLIVNYSLCYLIKILRPVDASIFQMNRGKRKINAVLFDRIKVFFMISRTAKKSMLLYVKFAKENSYSHLEKKIRKKN